MRQPLCSHEAHTGATSDFVLRQKNPPYGKCYVPSRSTCRPLLMVFPTMKGWGPRIRLDLSSQYAHLWATSDFPPPLKPPGPTIVRVYAPTMPILGPLLILPPPPPPLNCPGNPIGQGLCSQQTHIGATFDFVPRCEAYRPPKTASVTWPLSPHWGDF